jgi:DNA-binding MarR family transcriptional regulator
MSVVHHSAVVSRTLGPITDKMRIALKAIAAHWSEHELPPTYAELGGRLGVSDTTVSDILARLERRGLVSRVANRARSVRLTSAGTQEVAA